MGTTTGARDVDASLFFFSRSQFLFTDTTDHLYHLSAVYWHGSPNDGLTKCIFSLLL